MVAALGGWSCHEALFFRREPNGLPGLVIVSANSTGVVMSELGADRVPKIDWWKLLISALFVGSISAGALILVH